MGAGASSNSGALACLRGTDPALRPAPRPAPRPVQAPACASALPRTFTATIRCRWVCCQQRVAASPREAPLECSQPSSPPPAPLHPPSSAPQNLLEASSRLRVEALALSQAQALPSEAFSWQPGGGEGGQGGVRAMTAFSRLLKVLVTQLLPRIAANECALAAQWAGVCALGRPGLALGGRCCSCRLAKPVQRSQQLLPSSCRLSATTPARAAAQARRARADQAAAAGQPSRGCVHRGSGEWDLWWPRLSASGVAWPVRLHACSGRLACCGLALSLPCMPPPQRAWLGAPPTNPTHAPQLTRAPTPPTPGGPPPGGVEGQPGGADADCQPV